MATVTDPLLKSTLKKVEEGVPDKYQRGYTQIMAAGMKAMFSEKTFPLMEDYLKDIKSPADVPKLVAHGIVKLISVLYNGSQGKMQVEATGPASVALMCHALEYVEQVLGIPVDKDLVAKTTHLVSQGLMIFLKQASGLSEEDFQKAITPRDPNAPAEPAQPAAAPPQGGMIQGV